MAVDVDAVGLIERRDNLVHTAHEFEGLRLPDEVLVGCEDIVSYFRRRAGRVRTVEERDRIQQHDLQLSISTGTQKEV